MKSWRRTKEYRRWKVAVVRRDKRCVLCGTIHHRHAHHIQDGSNHPELRFDTNNGITLCRECHKQLHCNYKKSYRQKCTMDDWMNFVELVNYIGSIENDVYIG